MGWLIAPVLTPGSLRASREGESSATKRKKRESTMKDRGREGRDARDAKVVRKGEVGVGLAAELAAEEDLAVERLVVVDALLDLGACEGEEEAGQYDSTEEVKKRGRRKKEKKKEG